MLSSFITSLGILGLTLAALALILGAKHFFKKLLLFSVVLFLVSPYLLAHFSTVFYFVHNHQTTCIVLGIILMGAIAGGRFYMRRRRLRHLFSHAPVSLKKKVDREL